MLVEGREWLGHDHVVLQQAVAGLLRDHPLCHFCGWINR